jgi:hypothetical protein
VLLHGVGVIGKTSLVRVFERESAARGRQVRVLDCRGVEPVPLGLLGAIGTSLGMEVRNVSQMAAVIGASAQPMVFALDNYEALRLLDGWLRTEFLPALPTSARFIIMGRSLDTAPKDSYSRLGGPYSEFAAGASSGRRCRSLPGQPRVHGSGSAPDCPFLQRKSSRSPVVYS